MNARINLGDFFAGTVALFFIGLISIASQYSEQQFRENYRRECSVECFIWELRNFLKLSEKQEWKLKEIGYAFYDRASYIKEAYRENNGEASRELDILISRRNAQILGILNGNQKEKLDKEEFFSLARRLNVTDR